MNLPGFPQLPTDNLYKFKAIAGLSAFFLGALALAWIVWQAQLAWAGDRASNARIVTIGQQIQQEAKLFDVFVARRDSVGIDRKRGTVDSLKALFDHQVDIANTASARDEQMLWPTYWLSVPLMFVTVFAGYLSLVAFRDWYTKHQQYQDRLLVAQTELAELEVLGLRIERSPIDDTVEATDRAKKQSREPSPPRTAS